MRAGSSSGNVTRRNVCHVPAPRSCAASSSDRLSRPRSGMIVEDHVRERHDDVADHDGVQTQADVHAGHPGEHLVHEGEQQQQRDPEHEVRDHERREEQRRRRGLPGEPPADQGERGHHAQRNGDAARGRGDDGLRLSAPIRSALWKNCVYQCVVNPWSGNDTSPLSNENIARITIGA